jgi:flagellar biosynthesis protein FliP
MGSIDKYNMISLAPSLLIIGASIVMAIVGIKLLKDAIAKDAAKAEK